MKINKSFSIFQISLAVLVTAAIVSSSETHNKDHTGHGRFPQGINQKFADKFGHRPVSATSNHGNGQSTDHKDPDQKDGPHAVRASHRYGR